MDQEAVTCFAELLQIANRLLGPKGCPWDHTQTLLTLKEYLLEEAYELLEAIDLADDPNIIEEVGDLFYNLIFIAKLGEKEGRFALKDSLESVKNKLIARHPHVFGDTQVSSIQEIRENWEKVKATEKPTRQHPLDGIAKNLPALARAYEVIDKGRKESSERASCNEEEMGAQLWQLVQKSVAAGIHPEFALLKYTREQEQKIRAAT